MLRSQAAQRGRKSKSILVNFILFQGTGAPRCTANFMELRLPVSREPPSLFSLSFPAFAGEF